jgi:hypothetical protein
MEKNPFTKRTWLRAVQYGACEGSKEHDEIRVFNTDKCVLNALEAIGYEIGLTSDAMIGYDCLDVTVEALLMALVYWLMIKPCNDDKWVQKVGDFVEEMKGYITREQHHICLDDARWAVAIEKDRPKCFKEWRVFDYASGNSAGNMEANLKKKRKLHDYSEQERFPIQERQLVVEEYEEEIV